MSDQNVKAAQKYLNAMFGGHKDWVKLDEDGKTGTAVMQGIIRAFQIQNGISTITGTVGPLTINTMKKLAIITKMDPNDTPQVNCMLDSVCSVLQRICCWRNYWNLLYIRSKCS